MITTISLLDIHHCKVTVFFLVMRPFKVYSLSNFQIYNTVLLVCLFWQCCAARGILVPWPGIKPKPPAVEAQSLTTGPPGESPVLLTIVTMLYLTSLWLIYFITGIFLPLTTFTHLPTLFVLVFQYLGYVVSRYETCLFYLEFIEFLGCLDCLLTI